MQKFTLLKVGLFLLLGIMSSALWGQTTDDPQNLTANPNPICAGSTCELGATATNAEIYWYTQQSGGVPFDTTLSGETTEVSSTVSTTYYASAKELALAPITANNSALVDHNSYSGDDRGGIAVTRDYYYYVGDNNTVRFDMPNLTSPVFYVKRDGIFSDLKDNGTLYTLWNTNTNTDPVGVDVLNYEINSIRTLNTDLTLGTTIIPLSQSITISGRNYFDASGIFAGEGFMILFNVNDDNIYKIELPSGEVSLLSNYPLNSVLFPSENWADWGIAEFDGTDYSVVFRQNATNNISRLNLTTSIISVIQTFTNLSDMSCITEAPWYNRWYFHHERGSQFGGSDETAGYADGTTVVGDRKLESDRVAVSVTIDDEAPVAVCMDDTIYLDESGTVTITADDIDSGSSDNVGLKSKQISKSSFDCSNLALDNGTCLRFDGVDDYVNVNQAVIPTSGDFTVGVWVKSVAGQTSYREILSQSGLSGNFYIGHDAGGTVRVSDDWTNTGIPFPEDGEWHHFAVVKNASNTFLYIDGTMMVEKGSAIPNPNGPRFKLSSQYSSQGRDSWENLAGDIDEVTIWNTAKTSSEIHTLINGSPIGDEADLVAYYNMEQMVGGTTLVDVTGNGNDGTLTNMDAPNVWVEEFNPFQVVVLTVADLCGSTDSCVSKITVEDNLNPTAQARDTILFLNSDGIVVLSAADVDDSSTDNCGIDTMYLSQDTFDCGDVGFFPPPPHVAAVGLKSAARDDSPVGMMVQLTVEDGSGNSHSELFNVTVLDTISPTAVCHDVEVWLDTFGNVTLDSAYLDSGSSDACGIDSIALDISTFDCSSVGANTVVMMVTDVNGNFSTCSSTVTVSDTIAPVISCKPNTLALDSSGNASFTEGTGNIYFTGTKGNQIWKYDGENVTELYSPAAAHPSGPVGIRYVPENGNLYWAGGTNPEIYVAPADGSLPPSVLENSRGGGIRSLAIEIDYSGNRYFYGDTYSNNIYKANLDGTGSPVVLPVLGFYPGIGLKYNPDNSKLYFSDIHNSRIVSMNDDGSGFAVLFDGADGVRAPKDIAIDIVNSKIYWTNTGTGSIMSGNMDGSGIPSVVYSADPRGGWLSFAGAYGLCLDQSTQTLYWTTSLSGSNPYDDKIYKAPADGSGTPEIVVEGNFGSIRGIFVDQGGLGINAGISDACGIVDTVYSQTDFTCSNVGDNLVEMTVTDVNGNSSSCSSIVTIIDTIAPIVHCQSIEMILDDSGASTIDATDIDNGSTDVCGIASMELNKSSFDGTNIGSNAVVLTVTDANGNVSTCTSTVTVKDTIAPVALCKNIGIALDEEGKAKVYPAFVDNGSTDEGGIVSYSLDVDRFSCADVGENTVVMSIRDVGGNVSTCSATVTVNDSWLPEVACKDLEVSLTAEGIAIIDSSMVDNGSTAMCGISGIELSQSIFTGADLGENSITMTVANKSGVTASCEAKVSVKDEIAPVANCNSIDVWLSDSSVYELSADDILMLANGSSDNASPSDSLQIEVTPTTFDCSNIGDSVAVEVSITDQAGNESSCEAMVYVNDSTGLQLNSLADIEISLAAGVCETAIDYPEVFSAKPCVIFTQLEGHGADGLFPVGTTVEIWEATNGTVTDTVSFSVIVNSENAVPTLDSIGNVIANEDEIPVTVVLSGISGGNDCTVQDVTVTATNKNTALVIGINVSYTAIDSAWVLNITLAENESGTDSVTVVVEDSEGAKTSRIFALEVAPVNDAPVLLTQLEDVELKANDTVSISIPTVLGTVFDDIDDATLVYTITMIDTKDAPSWLSVSEMDDELLIGLHPLLSDTGCYHVILEATDAAGATASDTFDVCVEELLTGIGDFNNSEFEFTMYPNPSRGMVSLDLTTSFTGEAELYVMSIPGQQIFHKTYLSNDRIKFDLSDQVSGSYLVILQVEGERTVKKLILDRK